MTISSLSNSGNFQISLSPNQRFLAISQGGSKACDQTRTRIVIDLTRYSYADWMKGLSLLEGQVTSSLNISRIKELLSTFSFSSPRMLCAPIQSPSPIKEMLNSPIMDNKVWSLIGQMEPMGTCHLLNSFKGLLPSLEFDTSVRFYLTNLSPDNLGILTRVGTRNGYAETVRVLTSLPKFNEISHDDLTWAVEGAAERGDTAIVRTLIQSDRYGRTPLGSLGGALVKSVAKGHTETVRALIQSHRFKDIYPSDLSWAILHAAENGHTEIFKALVQTDRFNQIATNIKDRIQKLETNHEIADMIKFIGQKI